MTLKLKYDSCFEVIIKMTLMPLQIRFYDDICEELLGKYVHNDEAFNFIVGGIIIYYILFVDRALLPQGLRPLTKRDLKYSLRNS